MTTERTLKTNSTTKIGRPQTEVTISQPYPFKIWFGRKVEEFRKTGGRMFRTSSSSIFTLVRKDGLITFRSCRSIEKEYKQYESRFFVISKLSFEENAGLDKKPSLCVVV